ncbi:MAG: hypothetical protein HQM10_13070 [Candidatus Riflebacteria bacterium]|nr:hypothetical protein [Candidatus Riflebacteria bacterium]
MILLIMLILISGQSDAAEHKKIGIFPGSFDPIHLDHIRIAIDAAQEYKLDKVFFLVNRLHPTKNNLSDWTFREGLLRKAISEIADPRLALFEISLEASDPEKILEEALEKFSGSFVFHIIGEDSLEKFTKGNGFKRLGRNYNLIVKPREGEQQIAKLQKRTDQSRYIKYLPSVSHGFSSTQIREACAKGDIDSLYLRTPTSVADEIVKSGAYGLEFTPQWFDALIKVSEKSEDEKKYDDSAVILPFTVSASWTASITSFSFVAPDEEIRKIDFSAPHSFSDLKKYVGNKLTELGMKVLAKPDISVFLFSGTESLLHSWLLANGVKSAALITRSRSVITTGILLCKTSLGRYIAVIPRMYGSMRELQSQALISAAMALSGKPADSFLIIKSREPIEDFRETREIYSKSLSSVKPGTIHSAVIGFHREISKILSEKHLNGAISNISAYNDKDLPHCIAEFSNSDNTKKNILFSESVYGDQLFALLDILANEKKIINIIFLGGCGAITNDAKIGDIFVPLRVYDRSGGYILNSNIVKNSDMESLNMKTGNAYSVFSPIQETVSFIDDLRSKDFQIIDVELSSFARFIAGQGNKQLMYKAYLIVSNLPGSLETLENISDIQETIDLSINKILNIILK